MNQLLQILASSTMYRLPTQYGHGIDYGSIARVRRRNRRAKVIRRS